MNASKAIWAASTNGVGMLITFLTFVQPYLPASVGGPLAAVMFLANPVAVYIVPNIKRIAADIESVIKDSKTGDINALVRDGAVFIRQDFLPFFDALKSAKTDTSASTARATAGQVAAQAVNDAGAAYSQAAAAAQSAAQNVTRAAVSAEQAAAQVVGQTVANVQRSVNQVAAQPVRAAEQAAASVPNIVSNVVAQAEQAAAPIVAAVNGTVAEANREARGVLGRLGL